jgi:hypothetical protein
MGPPSRCPDGSHGASGYDVHVTARRHRGARNEPHNISGIDYGQLDPLRLVLCGYEDFLCSHALPHFPSGPKNKSSIIPQILGSSFLGDILRSPVIG